MFVWLNIWDCLNKLTLKINHHNDQELLYLQFKNKGNNSYGLSSSLATPLSNSAILFIDLLFYLEVLSEHVYLRICKNTLKKEIKF